MLGVYEFLPNLDLFKLIGQQLCRDTSPFIALCENILFLIVGFNERNLNAVSPVICVLILGNQLKLSLTKPFQI